MEKNLKYKEIQQEVMNYYGNKDNNSWRNKFHIEMPLGLVNDPNGLAYYNDTFHVFYQWNPFGCEHENKCWGVVRTKDFVNYTVPQIVLKPDDWFDKDGCYTGGAYIKDDILKLFYTGNVKGENGERISYQCLADYNNVGMAEKKGPVIEKQPEGYTAHFRDPMIFKKDDIYYMILGIQNEHLKGRVVLYKSYDIEKWEYTGELKTNMKDFGYMWECPNVFEIDEEKYALIFSPQGLKAEEYKYQSIYQSGYVIGSLNMKELSLDNHSEFKELDMGFDFYAPQIFDYNGEIVMLAWAGSGSEEKSEYPTTDYGWVFGLTMPRVLEYKNNILYQRPFELMGNLRNTKIIELENEVFDGYRFKSDSRRIEFQLDLSLETCTSAELKFHFADEYISVNYNKETEECTVDRSNMKLGGKGKRKFKLKAKNELRLHAFIDNSIMEIYYQDGVEVTTLMYFPLNDDFEIEIMENVRINKLTIWSLKEIEYLDKTE